MVTKIDRLGRLVAQINEIIDSLMDRGIRMHVLNMGVMDDTATGRLMRNMMLAFAEFERDMIVQRTQEGEAVIRRREGTARAKAEAHETARNCSKRTPTPR